MPQIYREMEDGEIKDKLRAICRTSSSEDQIRKRIKDELGCPHSPSISFIVAETKVDAEARTIGAALGGCVSENGAMVMLMVFGPRGNILQV